MKIFVDEETRDGRLGPRIGASTFALQPIVATSPVLERDLYFRPQAFWEPSDHGDEGLYLPGGCILDFDTLVNAFFEWHWVRLTSTTATVLVLDVVGEAEVHVYRTPQTGRRKRIATHSLQTGVHSLTLPPSSGASGRLSFVIAARAAGLTLRSGSWSTATPPRHSALLNVAICTFNKKDCLAPLLEGLAATIATMEAFGRVFVVDQGTERFAAEPDHGPATSRAIASGQIEVVEQENFGGSGGFTRGIIESLRRRPDSAACTHVLLMDDDVQFEPRLLEKLVHFLERCPADMVVGGSMMDMYRPEHLFAYSETFNAARAHVERQQPYDMDMLDPRSLGRFQEAATGNYNGWFVCCFPRVAFEQHGLPMPFFIRSDDCEFGMRLTRAGLPLAHMPGLFVWHEPFWNKPRAWIEYYSYRNHLIAADLASKKTGPFRAFRQLAEFWHYIGTYQYDTALAVCLVTEHYCKGPDWVFGPAGTRHAAVLREFKTFAENKPDGHVTRTPLCPVHGDKPRSRLQRWLPLWVAFLFNIHWNLFGRDHSLGHCSAALQAVPTSDLWWGPCHKFPVVIRDTPDSEVFTVLRHDPQVARKLTSRMLRAAFCHLKGVRSIAAAYRSSLPLYSSFEAWAARLGLPPLEGCVRAPVERGNDRLRIDGVSVKGPAAEHAPRSLRQTG